MICDSATRDFEGLVLDPKALSVEVHLERDRDGLRVTM